jgi:hypothetical protein
MIVNMETDLDVEPEYPLLCADCGHEIPIGKAIKAESDDAMLCYDCEDDRPWISDCGCGYEGSGEEVDMGICGDCHDHCGYVK